MFSVTFRAGGAFIFVGARLSIIVTAIRRCLRTDEVSYDTRCTSDGSGGSDGSGVYIRDIQS